MIKLLPLIEESKIVNPDIFYHGTTLKKYLSILEHGFDKSRIGEVDEWYGKGIYFSRPKLSGYSKYIAINIKDFKIFNYIVEDNRGTIPARESFLKQLLQNKQALEIYLDKYRNIEFGRYNSENGLPKEKYKNENIKWGKYTPEQIKKSQSLNTIPIFSEGSLFLTGNEVLPLLGYDGILIERGDGDFWLCIYNVDKVNKKFIK